MHFLMSRQSGYTVKEIISLKKDIKGKYKRFITEMLTHNYNDVYVPAWLKRDEDAEEGDAFAIKTGDIADEIATQVEKRLRKHIPREELDAFAIDLLEKKQIKDKIAAEKLKQK